MDSLTHIAFACRLLAACEMDATAAPCCLLADLDRSPAYLHRLYAHNFGRAGLIIRKTLPHLYAGGTPGKDVEWIQQRCLDERDRILQLTGEHLGDQVAPSTWPAPSQESAMLAFVGRLYLEHFTTPLQPFLPWSMQFCGRWDLWEEREPLKFRLSLFQPGNCRELRRAVANDAPWERPLNYEGVIGAIVGRLAGAAQGDAIAADIVAGATSELGVTYRPHHPDTQSATMALAAFEDAIDSAIRRCSGPGFSPGPRGGLLEPT